MLSDQGTVPVVALMTLTIMIFIASLVANHYLGPQEIDENDYAKLTVLLQQTPNIRHHLASALQDDSRITYTEYKRILSQFEVEESQASKLALMKALGPSNDSSVTMQP